MPTDEKSPEELFELFLLRARKAALRMWVFRSVLRGFVWNAVLLGVAICFRHVLHVELLFLLLIAVLVSATTTAICLWRQRCIVTDFAETLDSLYCAEGRIVSAAEFIQKANKDPYKRLAISEAGYWIATRPEPLRQNRPIESYLVVPAVALVYLACRLT